MRPMSPIETGRSLSRTRVCPRLVSIARRTAAFGAFALLLGLWVPSACGTVQSQSGDDVYPTDNPFSPTIDEGLPDLGHSIDPFRDPNAAAQEDFFGGSGFEGHYDVVVGKSGYGTLLISGGSDVRAEHLIIGDSEDETFADLGIDPYRDFQDEPPIPPGGDQYTGVRGQTLLGNGEGRHGSGVVRIEGFSSLYNNDYTILPPGLPSAFGTVRGNGTDPDSTDYKDGFDAYVGRWGNGRLEITAGGRAEIRDAVIVGDWGGSVGVVIVDGVDSFLGSGGYPAGVTTDPDEVHHFVIGRRGSGTVNILNGGQVYSRGPDLTGTSADAPTAAVIGGDVFDTTAPDAGGTGTVWVDGSGSTWITGGNLQVGAFHDADDSTSPGRDIEGDDVDYSQSDIGVGTLTVSNGALVSVVPPTVDAATTTFNELLLVIGRRGTITLQGGRIEMQGGLESGTNPQPIIDSVQLINDGLIAGDGQILAGAFYNRYLGQIRVGAGEKLLVAANTTFLPPPDTRPVPLANYGVIEVLGTPEVRAELEFDRVPDMFDDPINAFHNYRLTTPPATGLTAGQILAQNATLRFRSGLMNQGMLAFTSGTNIVQGDIINEAESVPLAGDEGRIIIRGDGTSVTLENDLFNLGYLRVDANTELISLPTSSFVTAGTLRVELGGGATGQEISQILIAGDAGIAGALEVVGPGGLDLSLGDSFEIISVSGQLGGVDFSNPLIPQPDLSVAPLFTSLIMPDISAFGANLVLVPQYTSTSVLLSVLSTALVSGADFNGDGIVDLLDFAIWRANFGITSGATGLQGDADGDGDVDGDDFLLLQMQLGGPPPGAGSGALVGGNVPEPASGVLLLSGALLALAAARRRRCR